MKWLVAVCLTMAACGSSIPELPDASGGGGGKDAGLTKPDSGTIPDDAGTTMEEDAGTRDAGANLDAGVADAGRPDAGFPDAGPGEAICLDGLDDDHDGLTDCLDPDCATRVCRNSAGACDSAEVCASGACPADNFLPASTTCRSSAGDCDVAESCTGSSAACPADLMKSGGVECRASAGACDLNETCTGVTPTCPADALMPSTAVCRTSTGTCDTEEKCTGSSVVCPADAFTLAGIVCRNSAGDCDVAETCTGTTAACPADQLVAPGSTCRPVAGICDFPEVCTGASPLCPQDGFLTGTTCRLAAGICDKTDVCDGNGPSCPADAVQPSTFVCRTPTCSNNQSIPTTYCAGGTQCPVPAATSCGAYICQNANQCFTSCTADSACATGQFCSADPFGGGGNSCLPKQANGTSCFKGSQCSSGACTQFWRDADNDTFTTTAASLCGTVPPSGYRATNKGSDCDDNANDVFPGATYFHANSRPNGSWDYNCDGIQEREVTALGGCQGVACTYPGPSWLGPAVPACGQPGPMLLSCQFNLFTCNYSQATSWQLCR